MLKLRTILIALCLLQSEKSFNLEIAISMDDPEGNTKTLRDGLRSYLSGRHLRNGYVTIDASDWYISDRSVSAHEHGVKMIDAEDAYRDSISNDLPNTIPAGQSLIWAMAKATGRYENELRYPGEDGDYQKAEMDKWGP